MECRKSSELLIRNQLSLLSPAEAAALRGHLAVCSGCRLQAEDYAEAVHLLQQRFEAEPPAGLAQRIMAKIPAADSKVRASWRLLLPLASAVISAIMLVFSYRLWNQPSIPLVDYYVLGGRTVNEIISSQYARYQPLLYEERGGK